MMSVYYLKKDLVIPAGTMLVKGPDKTTYSGSNYVAVIEISKDETAELVVYLDRDTLALLKEEDDDRQNND